LNIVVVGGGTAGWLTALYAKLMLPQNKIVLIESEEIGILGAGEGSTPRLVQFLNLLGISTEDLIKNASVSIKNGIKFTNWSEKNQPYMHPFGSMFPASNDYNFSLIPDVEVDTAFSHILSSAFDHDIEKFSFVQNFSFLNKVPFFDNENFQDKDFLTEPISSISLHFDAHLLAKYLRFVGESRGIIRKEGVVKNIFANENGEIVSLQTNNENIDVDFVFDCTGFKRLIIGNFYKSKWKSHEEFLPVNKAIPFALPTDKEIPPYTESIAMDYGWMWKIPLQHRYGCGYVFDSNMISEEDAKNELDIFMGFEVESPKSFSFSAGNYEKIWIKNCLAVGLSAGFVEPLEATSIWQSITVLVNFFSSYGNLVTNNEKIKDNFNKRYSLETREVVDFIYLHYVTDKKNTKFWKNFTKNHKMPDFIEYLISVAKERPLGIEIDFLDRIVMFSLPSYYYVMIGNNTLTKENLKNQHLLLKTDKKNEYLNIISKQNFYIEKLQKHNMFLQKNGAKI